MPLNCPLGTDTAGNMEPTAALLIQPPALATDTTLLTDAVGPSALTGCQPHIDTQDGQEGPEAASLGQSQSQERQPAEYAHGSEEVRSQSVAF